jgi:hypothetical protein
MPSVGKFSAMRMPCHQVSHASNVLCEYTLLPHWHGHHYASLDHYDTVLYCIPVIKRCGAIRWLDKAQGKQSGVSILKLARKLLFRYEDNMTLENTT